MRKFCLYMVTLLFLFSCSNEEDGSDNIPTNKDTFFSPPTWIQDEWMIISEEHFSNPNLSGLKFTNNDFIFVYDDRYESQNWFINKVNSPAVYATEQISTTNYIISMHYILATEVYNFTPNSDSEISCSFKFDDESNRIWNVTLTKK